MRPAIAQIEEQMRYAFNNEVRLEDDFEYLEGGWVSPSRVMDSTMIRRRKVCLWGIKGGRNKKRKNRETEFKNEEKGQSLEEGLRKRLQRFTSASQCFEGRDDRLILSPTKFQIRKSLEIEITFPYLTNRLIGHG